MFQRIHLLVCAFTIIFVIGCASVSEKSDTDHNMIYVSTNGDDTWSGQLESPNSDRSDGPLATLKQAKILMREVLANGPLRVSVFLREGEYRIRETLEFNSLDSGDEQNPVVWSAYPGEDARLVGGEVITDYSALSDSDARNKIPAPYHQHIVQIDLKSQGITDYGSLKKTGFGRPVQPAALELFYKGEPMRLAEYPNNEWLRIESVPQEADSLVHEGSERVKRFGIPIGRHFGKFTYPGERPSTWSSTGNVWVHGYWTHDWAESYENVDRIDTTKNLVYTEAPHGVYGYTQNQPFRFLNVLEELDSPGEWFLDRKAGMLYFWPPGELSEGDLMVSILEEPMIVLTNATHMRFENLVFEASRGTGAEIHGGASNAFRGCTFRNVGNTGVVIEGGTLNGVESSDVYYTGGAGITLSGGDRLTLTPAGNYVRNNHIHHFARINRTYRPAVRIRGVGNILAHNYIHDAPHAGVLFGGNDHLLEFNEIRNIARETGDVGAFYIGRNWTTRGNIIRYNYFHDLHGPGLHGVMAVYLDDAASGMTILGNVFYKAGRAAFIGGGHDNRVENNIFVECDPAVHLDARGLGWASNYIKKGGSWNMYEKLEEVNYQSPPYSIRYPELTDILEEGNPAMPSDNAIVRNISINSRWLEVDDKVDLEHNSINNNFIDIPMEFTDSSGFSYRLPKSSVAMKNGFEEIPVQKMGLYIDKYRTMLPE